MTTREEVIALAKKLLVKHGGLNPTLLIEGSTGSVIRPLPDAPEPIKLSLLAALGFALAKEHTIGELVQVWLIAEGWASRQPYQSGVPATQPQHATDRQEVIMVCCYQAVDQAKMMTVYETIRTDTGDLRELRRLNQSDQTGELVQSAPLEAVIRGFTRGRMNVQKRDQH